MTPQNPCPDQCAAVAVLDERVDQIEDRLDKQDAHCKRHQETFAQHCVDKAVQVAELRAQMRVAAFLGSLLGGGIVTLLLTILGWFIKKGGLR